MRHRHTSQHGHRAGLTLIETLAAVALLAAIAAACAAAFRDLRQASERERACRRTPCLATPVADALVERPSRLGLTTLSDLGGSPRTLSPDSELEAAIRDLRVAAGLPGQARDDAPIKAHTLRSRPMRTAPISPRAHVRRVPTPHWLIVEVDGNVAVRCILIAEEAAP